jgi:endonuclease/exonuclease/phosphatase family metal-dependent hydrolase
MFGRFIILLLYLTCLRAAHPIVIDGLFDDWQEVPVTITDPEGDYNYDDWAELKITNDDDFIFFKISLHSEETLLQNWNNFYLYIDADKDSLTGHSFRGLGAELAWHFGYRTGQYFEQDGIIDLWQNDITLRQAPTVTSTEFEIAIARGSFVLSDPDSIAVIFSSFYDTGDYMPDSWGGVVYQLDTTVVGPAEPILMEKTGTRLVTYNTLNTGILESDRQPKFQRIIQALDPDIIALQEHSEWNEIGDIISSWFPEDTWYQGYTFRDLVVLSKYPIINQANLISSERTMCALLQTDDPINPYLLILNSHFSCCDNDDDRHEQVDELVQVLREWRLNDNGPFDLPEGTPMFHVGDFNFVGYREQIETVTAGNIQDEGNYGSDFPLDWDSTAITDLFSRHTHKRMAYTWRSDGSSFNPGKLDYVLYTDSNLSILNHFVLNTLAMPDSILNEWELEAEDTNEASDHLPRIVDFMVTDLGITGELDLPQQYILSHPYPNPFNPQVMIPITLAREAHIQLRIYDIHGRLVISIADDVLPAGKKLFSWDGSQYPSGVYIVRCQAGHVMQTEKIILLK